MFSSKTLDRHNSLSTSIYVSILLLTSKQNSNPNCVFQDNITILSSDVWKSIFSKMLLELPLGTHSWTTKFLLIAVAHKQKC